MVDVVNYFSNKVHVRGFLDVPGFLDLFSKIVRCYNICNFSTHYKPLGFLLRSRCSEKLAKFLDENL